MTRSGYYESQHDFREHIVHLGGHTAPQDCSMIHTAQPTTATVPATATATNDPGTDDILASLPVPVVRLLILFSGPLAWARRALEVVRWRAETQVASWLVVVGWWGVCLGGRAVWR